MGGLVMVHLGIIGCGSITKFRHAPEYARNKNATIMGYYQIGKIQTNQSQSNSGIIDLFVDSIEKNTPPEISGAEGLAALKIIFACLESSASGQKIKIQ